MSVLRLPRLAVVRQLSNYAGYPPSFDMYHLISACQVDLTRLK